MATNRQISSAMPDNPFIDETTRFIMIGMKPPISYKYIDDAPKAPGQASYRGNIKVDGKVNVDATTINSKLIHRQDRGSR
jgi:hypothetical protein